jgi:hypothetical protein
MSLFKVEVGLVGIVYQGPSNSEAENIYEEYCEQSFSLVGNAANQPVTMWFQNEVIHSYDPESDDFGIDDGCGQ